MLKFFVLFIALARMGTILAVVRNITCKKCLLNINFKDENLPNHMNIHFFKVRFLLPRCKLR